MKSRAINYLVSVAIIGLVFAGIGISNHKVSANPFPEGRSFELIYSGRIPIADQRAGKIQVWVPLASEQSGQKILARQIKTAASYAIHKDPVYGNEMMYLEFKPPFPEEIDFSVAYQATVSKEGFSQKSEVEKFDTYLRPSRFMVVNEEVIRRSGEAVKGRTSWRDRARGIYDYVIRHMAYDKTVPGWGRGDTLRACLLGRGNCTDFHSLFISMAQAVKIPARFKIGFTIPNDREEGTIPGYHCWAEYYDEKKGWQPVDASDAWKHPERKEAYFGNFDTNKFLISVGRDIDLVPHQAGEPLNFFFYPYVEVDGKECKEVETSFQFKTIKS